MITITEQARTMFEAERRRLGKPDQGIQIGFLYGCGGAGFRVTFTDDPHGFHLNQKANEEVRGESTGQGQARQRCHTHGPPYPELRR